MSSPGRGSSHRSVALLGSLSVVIECLALGEGPPGFRPGFTCPTLLGYRLAQLPWSPTGLSPAPVPFSNGLRLTVADRLIVGPTTPAVCRRRFRLVPVRSPLLGESRLLSLPRPTEMFQFRRFPPQVLCVQTWVTGHDPGRVSPFGHPRILAFLAAPRGFSQPDASFIGSWRQGIHREPFVT